MGSIIKGGLKVSDQQAAVVDSVIVNRLTVVGAGAGSGKTHTSIATVLELLDQGKATIDQFILITYTNTAADNIRKRLEEEIQKKLTEETLVAERKRFWRSQLEKIASAYIGTIHSFCRLILSTYGYDERIAKSSEMTYSAYLRQLAFHKAISEHLVNSDEPKLLHAESDFKDHKLKSLLINALQEVYNQGYAMEDVLLWTNCQPNDEGKPYRSIFCNLLFHGHSRYKDAKLEKAVVDPHDLLFYTNKLLESSVNGPIAIKRLTQRFKYLFIDEFQDTNRLQLGIVEKLLPKDASEPSMSGVLVVGDRKQSIFGFSGAYASLLDELAEGRRTTVLPMNVARRPTANYLDVQNEIFESMGRRVPALNDKLQSFEGTFKPTTPIDPLTFIATVESATIEERIKLTARYINNKLLKEQIQYKQNEEPRRISPGDIVVLTRNNKQLNQYLSGLREELPDVKIRSDRGGSFFHKPEIVATYHMLRAIIHYPDDYVLSQALDSPYLSHVDATEMENHIISYGKKSGSPLTDWFRKNYVDSFSRLESLRKQLKVDPVPQFLENLYRTFNIRDHYKDDLKAVLALERLRELARDLFSNDQALTLRTFVDYLELNILTEASAQEMVVSDDDESSRPDYIRIMTIHRAKGLEFPIVIIPEVHEPIVPEKFFPSFLVLQNHGVEVMIPGQPSVSKKYWQTLKDKKNNQVEEEMRVFYVGVTRAEQALVLIGTKPVVNNPANWNAWQEPIWAVRPKLEALGARFYIASKV